MKKLETRGRKKLPLRKQRVSLSARIAPDVMERLRAMQAASGISLGLVIDGLVRSFP